MKVVKKKGKKESSKKIKDSILRKLPKLLEKDEVFKAQVITLFKPYFAEKDKTEERFNLLLEELREMKRESEERWKEITKRLDEHSKILEEHSKRLEEHSRILEEHSKRLEEHSKKLELLTEELINLRKRQDVQIGAIGARWGIKAERSFRNAVKGILEESFPIKVERYVVTDVEGEVFTTNPGSIVELDLIIRDGEVIVAEIKSSVSAADVEIFERKVKFYEKREGKKVAKKMIISPMVDAKALEFCEKLGIKVYTDIPEEEEL